MSVKRVHLCESELPSRWYNLQADLPKPCPPPLHPGTREPVPPEAWVGLFPKAVIAQEYSTERWIEIPDEVKKILSIWRPTPLTRARGLEKALKTPARIYFKDESVSPPGSHKPNTAVAQAYYNKQEGVKRLSTETGAGQWGSSLAFASGHFDLECKVYMVKVSYNAKPYRRSMMQVWGASVVPSPSPDTKCGREILKQDPGCLGSLGIAISEAVEDAMSNEDTRYSLGSVLNHVMLHQTIIGLEAEKQLAGLKEKPDVMVGCVGGGSNFAGLVFPFIPRKIKGDEIRFVAAEPRACPSITRGQYRYDFGDTTMLTPLIKMFTLGHTFMPAGIHAGGLRYHGMSPLVSACVEQKLVEPVAFYQTECFEAARLFAQTEGIIPAPETSHAIRAAINEALRCKETRKESCIVFNFSGHGICDLASYDKFLSGELEDFELPQAEIDKAEQSCPKVD